FGRSNYLWGRAKHSNPEAIKRSFVSQLECDIESGLAAESRNDRIRFFFFENLFDERGIEGLNIDSSRDLGIGHNRRRIRVDQNHLEPFFHQSLASLRSRIIEFAGLADDNRSASKNQ